MRSLEANFETAINAYTQSMATLVEMALSSTYRYVDSDIDIWYSSNQYLARGLKVSQVGFQLNMSVDKATLVLDNTDRSIGAIIEGNHVWDSVVTIRRAALTDIGAVSGQHAVFVGVIDSAEFNEQQAKFNIYNILIYWKRKAPRRFYSPSCQVNQFKDSYCAYSGAETWCDRSWERCVALSNSLNFRGFRWLPSLYGKQIYWGRTPAVT